METLEEIIDEYEAYGIIDNYNNSIDHVIKYLENEIKDNNESLALFTKKYRDRNSFFKDLKQLVTNPSKYEKINKILEEFQVLTTTQNKFFEELKDLINETNLKEISKLVDFMSYYYQESLVHLQRQLNAIDDIYSSVYYGDKRHDKRQVFYNEFIEDKINELKGVKSVEKTLKM